jgi:hypothetical protein
MNRSDFIKDNFDDDGLENFLFDRTLIDTSHISWTDASKINYNPQDTHHKVEYYINHYGYRSDEFDKDNEVLVLGCSQTFGSGMPNSFTWPDIFSSKINKKYSRLASRGDSINGQVYKAFSYFKEIGNPKIVVAAFPLWRLEYPVVPGKFLSMDGSYGNEALATAGPSVAYFHQPYLLKFSKVPHDPIYTIPKEFVIYYNFMFIKMLKQYCDSHNIKFICTVYEEPKIDDYIKINMPDLSKNLLITSDIIEGIGYPRDAIKHNMLGHEECFNKFKDDHLYFWAADYDKEKDLGHWGKHVHHHMAERFLERYKEIEND